MRVFFPVVLFLLLSSQSISQDLFYPELRPLYNEALAPFYFGVASGDPLPEAVVIWTKIIPKSAGSQSVGWEMATDSLMQHVAQSGTTSTDSTSAFTVKVDVPSLSPGTIYFYRFKYKDKYSPIGRTKTAPSGDPSMLRLAIVSCADYQGGYYNAFEDIAKRNDLDAVVHLGDYIYEYGVWRGGRKRMMKNRVREHIPDKTCTTLKDYRTRYGQYRLDQQLCEAHRLQPFIVIWDDHEIANNTSVNGPDGQDGPEWEQRKAAAKQAYFEWMPIRENPERSIVRKFTYGSLAELWMLDGRLAGRSPQAKGIDDPDLPSTQRHMLGEAQTEWLLKGINNSTAKWKIIGNQVIFSHLNDSKVFDRRPEIRMDRWDGYPAEQQHILDFFAENNLKNIIVVTGDVHTSWAFDLTADPSNPEIYDRKTGKGVFGAEFTTPSVTSFNFDEVVPKIISAEAKRRFKKKKNNPHLRYLDLNNHGYLLLTLTPEKAQADWYFVKTKKRVDDRVKCKASRFLLYNGNMVRKK
ncbi:MAG: alkaline phosphatase D family protein [Lewinellaceae bacterium]|nr:alkaline phosphatase D family protein [Saprospiraceae bacterium]MCB9339074.1 alkaline phosphatase D family protein [Lewinellaceae bacterium]